jgi:hypothetical protein
MANKLASIKSAVTDAIVSTLGIQTAIDEIPNKLADTIQPVINVDKTPYCDIVVANSGTGTLYTTPTDKDFYLTALSITSTSQNQSSTNTDSISVTLESGISGVIARCFTASGAASETTNSTNICFTNPIKIKRGTAITTTKNSSLCGFHIYGYLK